jgi:hypothetical protein
MSATSHSAETSQPPVDHRADEHDDERADLERLAVALRARGFQADLCAPDGRLPCLDVRNPRATVLAEKVYAQAGTFWWSWAEKLADSDEISTAAGILARVLRAAGE